MIEKLFWLICAIMLILIYSEDKAVRIALITLFMLSFLDAVFFDGVYTQFLIFTPLTIINDLGFAWITWAFIWTSDIFDYIVILQFDIIQWLMTPIGLFWGSITTIVLLLLIALEESISKIPRTEK